MVRVVPRGNGRRYAHGLAKAGPAILRARIENEAVVRPLVGRVAQRTAGPGNVQAARAVAAQDRALLAAPIGVDRRADLHLAPRPALQGLPRGQDTAAAVCARFAPRHDHMAVGQRQGRWQHPLIRQRRRQDRRRRAPAAAATFPRGEQLDGAVALSRSLHTTATVPLRAATAGAKRSRPSSSLPLSRTGSLQRPAAVGRNQDVAAIRPEIFAPHRMKDAGLVDGDLRAFLGDRTAGIGPGRQAQRLAPGALSERQLAEPQVRVAAPLVQEEGIARAGKAGQQRAPSVPASGQHRH